MVKGETRIGETTTVAPIIGVGKRISWGAVFAGIFVGVVAQIMLSLLGVAVGLGIAAATGTTGDATTVGVAAGVWLLITGFVSYWIAGWVAGRMSGNPSPRDGMWHGVVAWSVATVFSLFMLGSTAGAMMGGIGTLAGAFDMPPGMVQTMQQQTGLTPEQIQAQTGAIIDPNRQPSEQVTQTARQAVGWTAGAAGWAFFLLAVSAAGAAWGGFLGAPRNSAPSAYAA
jgi:hypothetical protein